VRDEPEKRPIVVGVISDTHGLVRPEAVAALAGVDRILHAGDIGSPEVIPALERVAPVHAIRGNNDREAWARRFPETDLVPIGDVSIYLVHDLARLDLDPKAAGIGVVVSGHSHRPAAGRRDGLLWLNPGSAGPRRFRLPICLARMRIAGPEVGYDFVDLETGASLAPGQPTWR
jgi:putative phosphoesterase